MIEVFVKKVNVYWRLRFLNQKKCDTMSENASQHVSYD